MVLKALAVAASFLAAACGEWKPNREVVIPSSVDAVTIASAQPPNGSVLVPGSQVALKYSLSYQLLTADGGRITMVLTDSEERTLNEAGNYPNASVTRGTGTAELSYSLTVPSSGVSAIIVNFPMFVGTSNRSQPMDAIRYEVRK